MSDIFISYASEDRERAKNLAEGLEAQGWSVWWDRKIPTGKTIHQVITQAMADTRCVVVIWSSKSVDSEWVLEEAEEGRKRQILVPVRIQEVTPPIGFRNIRAADLVDWDGKGQSSVFDQLVSDIASLFGSSPVQLQAETKRKAEAEKQRIALEEARQQEEEQLAELKRQREKLQAELAKERKTAKDKPVITVFRDTLKDSSKGSEMVVIPAGSFMMGSPEDEEGREHREGPRHEVTFARPFAMGKYAVTFDEYDTFAKATHRELPRDKEWGRGKRPVINVSWEDAAAYTKWLSRQTGKRYRLPTESEWEYAARAGTEGPFSFEEPIDTHKANYDATYTYGDSVKRKYRERTVRVGRLPANPWGLHEVHGNVREWVQDCWHETYEGSPVDGKAWLEAGGGDCRQRVFRGGSWHYGPNRLRSASRSRHLLSSRHATLGFRLTRDME